MRQISWFRRISLEKIRTDRQTRKDYEIIRFYLWTMNTLIYIIIIPNWKGISSIVYCWQIDNMTISNSKGIPKTTETIMNKQTGNIFILKKCRIFYFWTLNRQMNIMITPIKDACQNNWQESWINRQHLHPERIWNRCTLTLG